MEGLGICFHPSSNSLEHNDYASERKGEEYGVNGCAIDGVPNADAVTTVQMFAVPDSREIDDERDPEPDQAKNQGCAPIHDAPGLTACQFMGSSPAATALPETKPPSMSQSEARRCRYANSQRSFLRER